MGELLKHIRKTNKLTLKEASKLSGYSLPFLSQVERGECNHSIASLKHVLLCYGWKLSDFFNLIELDTKDFCIICHDEPEARCNSCKEKVCLNCFCHNFIGEDLCKKCST